MTKRIVSAGLGSHVALAAVCFMIVAGSLELSLLERIIAMAALAGWALLLLALLAYTHARWERTGGVRRAGLIVLALPGLTLGLPVVALYLLGSHKKARGRYPAHRNDDRASRGNAPTGLAL
jgi:hypothetical protein